MEGELIIPPDARGLVLFAHGSGSGRFSPRNRFVAGELNRGGLATLLFDLLTPAEEERRFDIPLLAERLVDAADWVADQDSAKHLRIGAFGASTGAAAALLAAAGEPRLFHAVVSRGGRPDLAGDALRQVQAPTLLIVGSHDEVVLELNEQAFELLPGKRRLEIVPGATHLFEEPGTLERVAALARDWFTCYL